MLLCANLLNIMVAFLYNDNNEYKHDMMDLPLYFQTSVIT